MPSFRSVKSRVTPAGTVTASMMMVEHSVFDTLAEEAPSEPLKVQVVALFSKSGAAVGAGAGAGTAMAKATLVNAMRGYRCMMVL